MHFSLWRDNPLCLTFLVPLILICEHKDFHASHTLVIMSGLLNINWTQTRCVTQSSHVYLTYMKPWVCFQHLKNETENQEKLPAELSLFSFIDSLTEMIRIRAHHIMQSAFLRKAWVTFVELVQGVIATVKPKWRHEQGERKLKKCNNEGVITQSRFVSLPWSPLRDMKQSSWSPEFDMIIIHLLFSHDIDLIISCLPTRLA